MFDKTNVVLLDSTAAHDADDADDADDIALASFVAKASGLNSCDM